MSTIGTANDLNEESYLIQYLRKSNLLCKSTNIGKYVNSILNTIIAPNIKPNELKKYKLCIYGSCWGKYYRNKNNWTVSNSAVDELIDVVFDNVPEALQIELINHYRGYSSADIYNSLTNTYKRSNVTKIPFYEYSTKKFLFYKYFNVKSPLYKYFNVKSPLYKCFNVKKKPKDKYKDHAKLVKLTYNDEILFYMIGSSNFSKTTYLDKDDGVDQCDIAFIKNTSQTKKLIRIILTSTSFNRPMLDSWRSLTATEINDSSTGTNEYLETIKNSTYLVFPYFGRGLFSSNSKEESDD